MSRVYDALQRSQGENPSSAPLVPVEPETALGEATDGTAAAAAVGIPTGEPMVAPPGIPTLASASTEFSTNAPTDASWLRVPADRVLHPQPTPEQRLVSLAEPDSAGAEMFRVLSTRLAHMQSKRRLQKLLITSSEGDEGKSVVSVNLALALARRPNQRTLLIEADLRRPTASSLLSSSPLPGITDWSEGKLALDDALYQVGDLPLWFLSAGHGIHEPMHLLE